MSVIILFTVYTSSLVDPQDNYLYKTECHNDLSEMYKCQDKTSQNFTVPV